MFKAWKGYPPNPEEDGLHHIGEGVALWFADRQAWTLMGRTRLVSPEWLAAQWWASYNGPCLTPDEVEARVNAARRKELEEVAAMFNLLAEEMRGVPVHATPEGLASIAHMYKEMAEDAR